VGVIEGGEMRVGVAVCRVAMRRKKGALSVHPGRKKTNERAWSPWALVAASKSESACSAAASMMECTKGGFAAKEPLSAERPKKDPLDPNGASTSVKPEEYAGRYALSGEAKHSNPTSSLEVSTFQTSGPTAAWKPCPRRLL